MADQNIQAVDDEKVVSAGEEASVSSPEETKATLEPQEEAKTAEEAATSEEVKAESEAKEEKRPSRSERRIRQLLDKLKEAKERSEGTGVGQQPQPPQSDTLSEILGTPSPFQPGAEVSLDELEAELNRRAATLAEMKAMEVVERYRQQERIAKAVEEFAGELERMAREVPELNDKSPEYDPDLDKKFAELVVAVNSDEKGQFLPKKRPSEIFEALKTAMEKAKTKGQVESTAKMAESLANAAVSPTAGAREHKDYEEEKLLDQARATGSTEAWAQYLKRRLFSQKK